MQRVGKIKEFWLFGLVEKIGGTDGGTERRDEHGAYSNPCRVIHPREDSALCFHSFLATP